MNTENRLAEVDRNWRSRAAAESIKEEKQNGHILRNVTLDMQRDRQFCLDAIRQNPANLKSIAAPFQFPQLCEAALEQDWKAIKYVKRPSYKMCQKALFDSMEERERCYSYLRNADSVVWNQLMKNGAEALRNCPPNLIDKDMCWHAVNFDKKALEYVPEKVMSYELCDHAWSRADDETKKEIFSMIPERYRNGPFCREALKLDPALLEFVPERVQEQIPHLCEIAVKQNPDCEQFLKIDLPRQSQNMSMAM